MKLMPLAAGITLFASCFFFSCNNDNKPAPGKPITVSDITDTLKKGDYLKMDFLNTAADTLLNDREMDSLFAMNRDTSSVLGIVKSNNNNDFGTIVPTETARLCLVEYERVMALHGITKTVTPVNINITQSLLITYYERFRGREIIAFLRKAAHLHGLFHRLGGKKKVIIRIAPGIYTQQYLDAIQQSNSDKLGRIGIFLISEAIETATKAKVRLTGPEDPEAFDFGGLQP